MKPEEAKDILSDMRDQHLCFLGDSEIKNEWQKNYLKEAWACDSGAKALAGLIPFNERLINVLLQKVFSTMAKTIKAPSAWKNVPNLYRQSVRQSVEKLTVITWWKRLQMC